MNLVDLFCGCGGFSLGAHHAGFNVKAAFDVDPILTSSYKRNFPDTDLRLRDVKGLHGQEIRDIVDGPIDGVFGGPPCQGFSDIGKRNVNDPRRDLLQDFFRIVDEVRPRFFVMENVRGLSYKDARGLLDKGINRVSGRYSILGPILLDASEFGAATSRTRLFVIGIDRERCAALTIEDIARWKRRPASVRAAISDLSAATLLEDPPEGFDTWRIAKRGRPSEYAAALRSIDGSFTGNRRTSHQPQTVARFARVEPGTHDPVGRHYKLRWDGLCPTLRAGTGADRGSYQSVRPLHPEEPRVITIREAARLQGFPDSHLFHPTIWHSFRMIGNSVSPIISKAIFGAIREKLVA
ncbi:DNA cytosine methyltransferase [Burkholderia lata]|uniref:DNA cytosine methyltransferase n=1 Tax=Burkholderia lata (strain ATCC 17760 / DSM 23089 / LMG 22485 / NCIMB 9086 / R18194 / 383) TaxID=482957 RepID=UPI001453B314|nr:DNA cytosine methyltransferase [Burkholderia lata]VWM12267.1 DNA cytosine methyltransferase [Burkholderia lata]